MNEHAQHLINKLHEYATPQDIIDDILNAKKWTDDEKIAFVNYHCDKINYLSSQASFNQDAATHLQITKYLYELYLNIINS